ncbi:hypothetical protein, partial [Scytonema sp. PCC 10023]|uniref:hypothetical protein n=1 Tax=Scytonema sp. PCC 10023 TaxID=1680591 RepID=UPI0039C68426
MATENIDTSNQSTTDTGSASVLERSPWGRVIDTTGSPDAVLQGFGSATGGDTSGGAPSGAGGAGSGSPFTNFGNPNAEGSPLTGGINPWAAIGTGGGSAPSGGGSTGGFGGASGGSQPVTRSSGSAGGDTSGSDASGGSQFGDAGTSGLDIRFGIENQVNGELTEALGENYLPTSQAFGSGGNNPFDPGFGNNVSNQASQAGGQSVFNGGAGDFGGGAGGFDVSSIGGFGGGAGGFGGGAGGFGGGAGG